MSDLKIWLEATRPKTLPAALSPVLLGSAAAHAVGAFDWRAATICLLFALLIQIGTNFANDYLDGVKGTDTPDRIGPRRAVAEGLIAPEVMKRATIGVLALGFCIGLGLIPFGGWALLLVGGASVACAWLYTGGPYPLAYNGLGDVFVVMFFGFIAVACTFYVQVGQVTSDVLLLGLSCGLLVNNILVVNNYRDLEEDLKARKRTLIVLLGRDFGLMQYVVSTSLAGGVVLWFVLRGYGLAVLLGLIPVVLSLRLSLLLRKASSAEDFLELLKLSGIVVALFGLCVSLGFVL
ncbi:MAG: 1,4-dihydroxy-2-naphthoate polyprenyltransferase [Verrucomicrobiota bacterium]